MCNSTLTGFCLTKRTRRKVVVGIRPLGKETAVNAATAAIFPVDDDLHAPLIEPRNHLRPRPIPLLGAKGEVFPFVMLYLADLNPHWQPDVLRCRVDSAQIFQQGVVRAMALCIRSLYMEVFQGEEVPCRSDRHEVRREVARVVAE